MNYQEQLDNAVAVTGSVATTFGLTATAHSAWQGLAEQAGLSDNGPYKVLGAWESKDVSVVLEQNSAPDVAGGALTVYPPTVVVERHSDGARVSVAGGAEETLGFVLKDLLGA